MKKVIDKTAILNYRSILRAGLEFGQITIICGPSDSGKSNLVRALRDWAFNASGMSFCTAGREHASVAVAIGLDKVVFDKKVKGRGSRGKFIHVNAEKGVRDTYEKVGLTVPEEIVSVTGIREVQIDDVKLRINFSEQAEPWFLLSPTAWTPGRVSKVIGRIAGIDPLILANKDLVSRRAGHSKEVKRLRQNVHDAKLELTQLPDLSKIDELLSTAAELAESIDSLRDRISRAENLISSIARMRRRVKRLRVMLDARRKVQKAASGGLLDRLAKIASVSSLMINRDEMITQRERSKKRLAEAVKDREKLRARFLELIDSEMSCPLCSGQAHDECRETLRREVQDAS